MRSRIHGYPLAALCLAALGRLAACSPSPTLAPDAADAWTGPLPDAALLKDRPVADAAVCLPPTTLPERVTLRTAWQSFNRRWVVALHKGRIWVKPNEDAGQTAGSWRLLGTGLPAGSGIVRFPPPTDIVELSADGVHLQALSSAGVFYRGTDFTGDVHASFTWTDRWGHPAAQGSGLKREFATTHGWSVSDAHPLGVAHYTDILGIQHDVGLGVAHLYRLGPDGRSLHYNDWWLPNDWSRRICLPDRDQFKAENLSASASTLFVVGTRGELYTRLYDFDTSGENDLLTYSYIVTGPSGTTRALPAEPWVRQPDITEGRITRNLTIVQDGKGSKARVLRVEGMRGTESGYYEKRIDGLAWTFHAQTTPVCGPLLDPSAPKPTAPPSLDARLTGTLSLDSHSVAVEIANFNLFCSPAQVQVRVGGALVTSQGTPLTLTLHHVHAMTLEQRATDYWKQGKAAPIRAALTVPHLSTLDSATARAALSAIIGARKIINFEGTATLTQLTLDEIPWTALFKVPAEEKALLGRVKLAAKP